MDPHPFVPSLDDRTRCGFQVTKPSHQFGGSTCAFPASNRRVHAPGAKAPAEKSAEPSPPLRLVPAIERGAVAVALEAPATSVAAAEVTLPNRASLRYQLVELLTHPGASLYGLTDDEIERVTNRAHTTVSSARRSLVLDGIVQPLLDDQGQPVTRPTVASGADAQAWTLTPAGRAAHRRDRRDRREASL